MVNQIVHTGQHPLRHRAREVRYLNPTLVGTVTVKEALDFLVAFGVNLNWKDPVANKAALPLTGNSLSDARIVQDDVESVELVFQYLFVPPAVNG